MIPESNLKKDTLKILEVDNKVIISKLTHISFMVTQADIIHFYTCPSSDAKYKVYLGKLNQVSIFINREDTFYS